MTETVPAVELREITRVFATKEIETQALHRVSLTIGRGELVAIVGPSGGGKSTLLSILGLLDAPTSGRYLLDGRDVDALDVNARAAIRNREIGFVFQSFNLIADLTVYENVELPLLYGGMSAEERSERVTAALRRVDMLHRRQHLPSQLSGGQQQRVAIARAICGEPTLLLADEPTGNLDSRNGDAIIDMLAELHAEGSTICMVTHDPRYARKAQRILYLVDGRIAGEPDAEMREILDEAGFRVESA